LAPGIETLDHLAAENATPFDMAFIDADKRSVDEYYERALQLLRPGGFVLVDNVLWDGAVLDAATRDEDTIALRRLNSKAGDDPRVEVALVPICDGLLIARKKP
jgi:caffeoyl-CoA O-methyltransferase